jgi:hypothetical protein
MQISIGIHHVGKRPWRDYIYQARFAGVALYKTRALLTSKSPSLFLFSFIRPADMRFAICVAALPIVVSAYHPPWGLARVAKRVDGYTFNMFTGSELQDSTSAQSPEQLQYTTGNGVPYVLLYVPLFVEIENLTGTLIPTRLSELEKTVLSYCKISTWYVSPTQD